MRNLRLKQTKAKHQYLYMSLCLCVMNRRSGRRSGWWFLSPARRESVASRCTTCGKEQACLQSLPFWRKLRSGSSGWQSASAWHRRWLKAARQAAPHFTSTQLSASTRLQHRCRKSGYLPSALWHFRYTHVQWSKTNATVYSHINMTGKPFEGHSFVLITSMLFKKLKMLLGVTWLQGQLV